MAGQIYMMARRRAARKATAGIWAVGVYSFAPNKANYPRFWPGNEGRARKQSQLGRAMAPTQIRSTKSETCPERSRMDPDKCEARMRKTTETLSPGGRNVWGFGFGCFELVSGFDTRSSSLPLWAFAPNKANLPRFRAENEGRAEKQSQFRRMRASAQIRSTNTQNDRNAPNKTAASKVGILRFHPQYRRKNAGCWRVSGLLACASNKANLPRSWPENGD